MKRRKQGAKPPRRRAGTGAEGPPRADGPDVLLYGRHPVGLAVAERPGEIERIFVARGSAKGLGSTLRRARAAGIPLTHLPRAVLGRKLGPGAAHQGIAARVSVQPYASAEQLCRSATGDEAALLLVLDGIEDPGNLGAILRTSAAAGVAGVLLGSQGTVGLTPAVFKSSAGTAARVPVAREPRIAARLRWLKDRGFHSFWLDPQGASEWDRVDLTGRLVLVAGGEARGVRPAVARACDGSVRIPLAPGIDSLNVAVSTGVLLFEALRQRRGRAGGLARPVPRC